jgi:hypothetical protein
MQVLLPGVPGVASRAIPDMFYLTTYSLLAYFWAQLSLTLAGASSRLLRPVLLGGLGLLWTTFVLVLVIIAFTPDAAAAPADLPPPLRAVLLYFLGLAYAVVFCFIGYFGLRIAVPARRRRAVFYRTIALGVTCGLALAVRATTCLALASGKLHCSMHIHHVSQCSFIQCLSS